MSPAPPRRLPALPVALLSSSALSVAFVVARAFVTGRPAYEFLLWNLTLAWIPYVLARVIVARARNEGGGLSLLAMGLPFLGFLPNAPYLVTDLMHLRWQTDAPHWFDVLMLASFAWSGLTLGIASVRLTADVVKRRVGHRASIGYVGIVSLLTAFGIYLGRFVRLNTWDAAVHPFRVARSVLAPLAHPAANMRAWTFTVAFAALFLAAYVSVHRRSEERP